jgi:CRP-like cAMP-binding protein
MRAAGRIAPPTVSVTEARVNLFDFITPEARRDLEAHATVRHVPAGGFVYAQDEQPHSLFRIRTGRVWLEHSTADGRELRYWLLGPGECLGITSAVDGEGLYHSAVARTDVTVEVVAQSDFDCLRAAHPSIAEGLLRILVRDVRIMVARLAEAVLEDLPARTARRLLALAIRRQGRHPSVELPQAELATAVGVSRQTLNKALKDLETSGVVQRAYGTIEIIDIDRLTHIAGVSNSR